MKETQKSLGTFKTLMELEQFLIDDNEKPYQVKGYKRKLRPNCIRNAFVESHNAKVWVYSRGFGLQFVFTEAEKNQLLA